MALLSPTTIGVPAGATDRTPEADRVPLPSKNPLRIERTAGVLFAGFAGLAASGPISDNSVLTHIATGRLQMSSGLPTANPFLWTSSDFPVPSWWWSWMLGAAEALGGLGAVRVLTVCVAAGLGWLLFGLNGELGRESAGGERSGLIARVAVCGVALLLLVPFLNARPQLGGFLALALVLRLWRGHRGWWWYLALFAIWVNVHGSWLYGVGVLLVLWIAESLDEGRWARERIRCLVAAAAGVLVGGMFYPERFRLVLLPSEQLGDSAAREAIRLFPEWRPPAAGQPWIWLFALVCVLAIYGATLPRPGERRRWAMVLSTCAFCVIGVTALRLLPVAVITLLGPATVGLDSLLGRPRLRAAAAAAAGPIAAVVGATALGVAVVLASFGPDLDLGRYPVEEVDWLEQRSLVAQSTVRLVHNDYVGNYLEFRYGDEANAWVDDRPSVETLIDYVALRQTADGWVGALERADPDVVLWQTGDELPGVLAEDSNWAEVLTTEDFRVFCHEEIAKRCR
ncbi:MAG: hypothetical protein KDB15_16320 [Microthrixaceae bacterium]|nr:hypothetical protein [Microthrixaceae bacterium]